MFAPFAPRYGSGQTVTAAAASASVSLPRGNKQIRVVNTGSNPAYIRVGFTSATATTADLYLVAGSIETFTVDQEADVLAYISPLGTTLNIINGEGW
jgi:hypothetical protein